MSRSYVDRLNINVDYRCDLAGKVMTIQQPQQTIMLLHCIVCYLTANLYPTFTVIYINCLTVHIPQQPEGLGPVVVSRCSPRIQFYGLLKQDEGGLGVSLLGLLHPLCLQTLDLLHPLCQLFFYVSTQTTFVSSWVTSSTRPKMDSRRSYMWFYFDDVVQYNCMCHCRHGR